MWIVVCLFSIYSYYIFAGSLYLIAFLFLFLKSIFPDIIHSSIFVTFSQMLYTRWVYVSTCFYLFFNYLIVQFFKTESFIMIQFHCRKNSWRLCLQLSASNIIRSFGLTFIPFDQYPFCLLCGLSNISDPSSQIIGHKKCFH